MVKNKLSRGLSLLLAVILSFSLVMPSAFAEDDAGTEDEISVETVEGPNAADTNDTTIEPESGSSETAEETADEYFTYDPDFSRKALEEYNSFWGDADDILDIDLSGTPMTMASTSAYISIGTCIWYGGEGWGGEMMYTTESGEATQQAYCLEPANYSPSGTFAKHYDLENYIHSGGAEQYQVDYLRKIMWYMPGCPGYEDGVEAGIWPDLWPSGFFYSGTTEYQMQYIAGHLLLSWYYTYDIDYALSYMSTYFVQWFENYVLGNYGDSSYDNTTGNKIVKYMPDPPSSFKIYVLNPNSGNRTQAILGWEYTPTGELSLQKVSGNSTITAGNACYSLEGAVYGVYSDAPLNDQVATLTTDENGNSNTVELDAGTYYVKEITASPGYQLDETPYTITVNSGETTTFTSVEQPDNDPLGLTLTKISSDNTENPAPLTGAQFTVKYYDGYYDNVNQLPSEATRTWVLETKEVSGNYIAGLSSGYRISGDDLYYNADGTDAVLPLGTITIQETKAPNGYMTTGSYLKTSSNTVAADTDGVLLLKVDEDFAASGGASLEGGNYYTKTDTPVSGGVAVRKIDHQRDTNVPQGDATLAGAELTVYSNNDYDVVVNGTTYTNGQAVVTLVTDAQGNASTGNHDLPFGTYTVKETAAPVGYLLNGSWSCTFNISEDGVIVDADQTPDDVMRGGVGIYKYDSETVNMMTTPQGDGDLAGAEFTIYNRSAESVYVNGAWYEPDDEIMTISTVRGSDGTHNWYYAGTEKDALPYGSYEIVETAASEGYLIGEKHEYSFSIDYDGDFEIIDIAESSDGNSGQFNDIIRGGIRIAKRDLETGLTTPLGAASLENAEFTITNESTYPVLVNGTLYQPGEDVLVLYTDEDGYASTGAYDLPYGSYRITETQAPEGYLPYDQNKNSDKDDAESAGVLTRTFRIRENGVILDYTDDDYEYTGPDSAEGGNAIYNQVIRGDFAIRKIDDDQHTMAGVVFQMTSETTGETHYFRTDGNGAYSSAAEYAKHTYDTNRYDDESLWEDDSYTDRAGMWFGLDAEPDNSLGALPYDTYTITEIRTEANEDHTLWSDTFTVGARDNNLVVDLNNIEDTIVILETAASFEDTGVQWGPAAENTVAVDSVSYENLISGQTYTLVTRLFDLTDENYVRDENGEEVTSVMEFTPRTRTGTVSSEIIFDATGLDGHDLVIYEYVFEGTEIDGDAYVWEADPEEEDQMLHFPVIGTTALDSDTEDHISCADEEITIVDTVAYENLRLGRTYTVTGTLMDRDTGREVRDAAGNTVTATAEFTAEEPDGTVDVTFVFDGTGLGGVTTVVFEEITSGGKLYAAHADINDEGQTVYIPGIHTTALDEATGTHEAEAGGTVTIVDTVEYTNLIPGYDYTMTGRLMDADTGEDLDITASTSFTPDTPDGSVDMTFTFDSGDYDDLTVAVFEYCELDGNLVAEHTDLTDTDQQVHMNGPETPASPDTPQEDTPTLTSSPKTGEIIAFSLVAAAALAAAVVLTVTSLRSRKKKNGEEE